MKNFLVGLTKAIIRMLTSFLPLLIIMLSVITVAFATLPAKAVLAYTKPKDDPMNLSPPVILPTSLPSLGCVPQTSEDETWEIWDGTPAHYISGPLEYNIVLEGTKASDVNFVSLLPNAGKFDRNFNYRGYSNGNRIKYWLIQSSIIVEGPRLFFCNNGDVFREVSNDMVEGDSEITVYTIACPPEVIINPVMHDMLGIGWDIMDAPTVNVWTSTVTIQKAGNVTYDLSVTNNLLAINGLGQKELVNGINDIYLKTENRNWGPIFISVCPDGLYLNESLKNQEITLPDLIEKEEGRIYEVD